MVSRTAEKTAEKTQQSASTAPAGQTAPVPPKEAAGALLQRVISPRPGDPLGVPSLYLDEAKSNHKRVRALGRTGLEIPSDPEVSFAAYFNAFPASYWRRWTTLDTVQLRLRG